LEQVFLNQGEIVTKRGLCFDLDGTLIDSGREGLKRVLKIAAVRNLPVTPEIKQRIRDMWGAEPFKLLRIIWPDEDPKAFFNEWENLDIAEPLPAFPGTREALKKLRPYFNMSIVTNRQPRTIFAQLLHNDIAEFFEQIITPAHNGHKKPEPEIMEPIFEKYKADQIERGGIILVGDTVENDWKLAQATGIEFYAVVSGGMDTREKFLAAGVPEDHITDSAADLPRILLK